LSESLYIDDAGEGDLHVSDQSFIPLQAPFPCPHPPTADIHRLVEINGCANNFLKSLGGNHYKAISLTTHSMSSIAIFHQPRTVAV
jgi:hypothetical protein